MSTEVLVKKDLILGGLTCAHCAEEIGKGIRKIDVATWENIRLADNGNQVILEHVNGDKFIVNLENYIRNDIMDFCANYR